MIYTAKRKFKYPAGVKKPKIKKPKMHNYSQKAALKKSLRKKRIAVAIRNKFSGGKYNKFNAHKIQFNGHKFDSKLEFRYYNYLKRKHVNFKVHTRYVTMPHTVYRSKYDGKKHYLRKRSYTPDFIIYDSSFKHIKFLVDIKGGKASPYSKLRMAECSLKLHVPVMIVKYRKHHFIYKENH